MIHIIKSFASKMWLAFILLIILGGVLMGGARLLLPIAAEYREEVQELVSKELGQQVKIETLDTSWRGYGPELILGNVDLINPETGQSSLRVTEIRIGIGILDSLFNQDITVREINFYRSQLLIKRRSDGAVVLAGLEDIEKGSSGDSSAIFLLPFRLGLKQSVIYWENQSIGADPVRFTDVNLTISNGKNRHQIDASMRLPGQSGGDLRLVADIKGAIQQSNAWSGEIYLTGNQLALATILKDRMPEGSAFETGTANMEIWSRWINGHLTAMEGYAAFDKLRLVSERKVNDNPMEPLAIERIGGRFRWQHSQDGWQVDIADIEFRRNGKTWPKANLSLVNKYDQEGNLHLASGVGFIRTEDLLSIVKMFPLPSKELDDLVHSLQPQADIRSMQFRFHGTTEGPSWSARGRLENISMDTWRGAPEIRRLNAGFWLDQNQGTLELDGKGLSISFPGLFRDAMQLQELNGRMRWSRAADGGWLVQSKKIIANNADIKTQTRFRLKIQPDLKQSPTLDLQTDFQDGKAGSTHKYLPVGIMGDEVVAWLDKSIVSGRVLTGSAIFRGPLADFPFDNDTGHFEVLFKVGDMVLDYQPGWPRIENLTAEVRFHNNSLAIREGSGTMLNSKVRNLYARIDDLEQTSPLRITGSATGPLSDNLKLLTETPLSKDYGEAAKRIAATGNTKLETKLTIPLDKGDYDINVKLLFDNASINLDNSKFPLTDVTGALALSQNGVNAKDIKAQLLGEDIKLDVAPIQGQDAAAIKVRGSISGTKLDKQFPGLGLDLLQGKSTWTLQFEIPSLSKNKGQITANKIVASSDLVGTTIDMPAPLGKTKDQKRSLQITTTISDEATQELNIDYADVASTAMQFSKNKKGEIRLERGDIILGGGKAQTPQERLLTISGALPQLDLTPWISYLPTNGDGGFPQIRGSNLRFRKLKVNDTELNNITLSFTKDDKALKLDLKSDNIDGRIQTALPIKSKPILADLDKLAFKLDPDELSGSVQAKSPDSMWKDPRNLPGMTINSKRFVVNGRDIGPLQFVATSTPEGLSFEKIKFSSKLLDMTATGSWLTKNNKDRSSLNMKMKSDSLGKLLTTIGFAPSLKDAPAKIEANLVWSGDPRQFSSTDVTGRVDMRIRDGRFLEVNPGLGRIFGLLNIDALTRRLTLDFSDTYKKGFSFDKAEGTFNLDHGDAYTNDLSIDGPAGSIDISGRTGLAAQDFDQQVTITPSVSSTIPVAGALAGGPAVGVALVLAQKIFGKTVDKVSTTRYTVTGSWDNPNIEQLSLDNQNREPATSGGATGYPQNRP